MERLRELIRQVYDANFGRLFRYALRLARNPEDALDIVHDAIARTLAAGPSLETEAETVAYISTVMRTTSAPAITRSNHKLRTQKLHEDFHLDAGASPLDILLSAEGKARRKRMLKLAWKRLKKLPKPIRQCVEPHIFRQPTMTIRAVAAKLGIGKSTVADRVNKGLDMIVTAVMEEMEEDR